MPSAMTRLSSLQCQRNRCHGQPTHYESISSPSNKLEVYRTPFVNTNIPEKERNTTIYADSEIDELTTNLLAELEIHPNALTHTPSRFSSAHHDPQTGKSWCELDRRKRSRIILITPNPFVVTLRKTECIWPVAKNKLCVYADAGQNGSGTAAYAAVVRS